MNLDDSKSLDDPRHVNQARSWQAALDAERAVFSEPAVMRTGVFAALRPNDTEPYYFTCGCLNNEAGAHRVGCPDHPEGVPGDRR